MNIQYHTQFKDFITEIKSKILSSQYEALKAVNKELIGLYWDIGKNILEKQEAFGWGKSIVKNLSDELQKEFVGMKGFSVQNLWNMRQFYFEYSKSTKLQTLSREIGWSHNVAIFQKCKDDLQREFYIKSVMKFGWTYRVLDNHDENPSIGIIICKEKKRTTVEYALKESNQPIGIATYKISENLPENLKQYLPTSSEIESKLLEFLEGNERND